MKDEDFIERKEKVLLAALGKSWLWKASRLIIGIIPPVGALVMLVHCTLLSFGIRVKLTEWIFDCSFFGFIAWIIVSLAYGVLLGASSVRYQRSADFILHRLPAFFRVRCFSPAAAAADGRPRAAALLRLHQEKGLE
jgi:hypothetical protein